MKLRIAMLLLCLCLPQCLYAGETEPAESFVLFRAGLPKLPLKFGETRLGTHAEITYRFLKGAPPSIEGMVDEDNCKDMQPIPPGPKKNMFESEFALAAGIWSKSIDVVIRPANESERADIIIGYQGEPYLFAFVNLRIKENRGKPVHTITQSLICLNPQLTYVTFPNVAGTFHVAYVFAHEIGHVLGQAHSDGKSKSGLMLRRYPPEPYQDVPVLSRSDIDGASYMYGAR